MYASPSARCHANSPSDRPPGSGRKSYCVSGNASRTFTVFAASRSHKARNISSSFIGIADLLQYVRNPTTRKRRRRDRVGTGTPCNCTTTPSDSVGTAWPDDGEGETKYCRISNGIALLGEGVFVRTRAVDRTDWDAKL